MKRLLLVVGLLLFLNAPSVANDWGVLARKVWGQHLALLKSADARCTTFAIEPNLYVTAAHCVLTGHPIQLNDVFVTEPATVVQVDPGLDLALLKSNLTKQPIPILNQSPHAGTILGIGYYHEKLQWRVNQVAQFGVWNLNQFLPQWNEVYVESMGGFQPGFSGGPIVDMNGRLAGVIVRANLRFKLGLAVTIHELNRFLNRGYPSHP